MTPDTKVKPVLAALSTVFAVNLLTVATASAAQNPFGATDLMAGYRVAGHNEGACGEGKCGASRMKLEGKCGEGKCGMDADEDGKVSREEFMRKREKGFSNMDSNSDGFIDSDEMKGAHEGKCGEGKCGANTGT